jgi:hypothetical protein
LRDQCDRQSRRPVQSSAARHRRRSRCGSNGSSGNDPIPRPCATVSAANATSIPRCRSGQSRAAIAVHEGEHHDAPAAVLGDGRDHAVGVPLERVQPGEGMVEVGHDRSQAHFDAARCHVFLGLAHGVFAEMEDRGSEHRIGVAFGHAVDQVLQVADAARGDHRNAAPPRIPCASAPGRSRPSCRRGPCWSAGSRRRRRQPCAAPIRPRRGRSRAPAVGENSQRRPRERSPAWRRWRPRCTAPRNLSRPRTRSGLVDRRGIDRDLVGAGVEQATDVLAPCARRRRRSAG